MTWEKMRQVQDNLWQHRTSSGWLEKAWDKFRITGDYMSQVNLRQHKDLAVKLWNEVVNKMLKLGSPEYYYMQVRRRI